jgi:hypothetical protein
MLHRRLPCSASVASGSATLSATVVIHPVALPVARHTFLGIAQPPSSSLHAAAAGATTRPTTAAAASGKRQKQRLQSKCPQAGPSEKYAGGGEG